MVPDEVGELLTATAIFIGGPAYICKRDRLLIGAALMTLTGLGIEINNHWHEWDLGRKLSHMTAISSTWMLIWFIATCLLIGLAVGQAVAVFLLRRELSSLHYRGSLRPVKGERS